METMVSMQNVQKSFGRTMAADIEALTVKRGSVYGLIGPNGAGKTTAMKMITGLAYADRGEICVAGLRAGKKNRIEIAKKLGALIESPAYYENLTGYENLDIVRRYKGIEKKHIDEALAIVGLTGHEKKRAGAYSLGMKQRLGIAMAIMGFPPLVILDEPTNGLDPRAMAEMRDLIRSLPRRFDTTVMLSSHDLDEIEKMADTIGIIGKGKMLYEGDMAAFKNRYRGEIRLRTSDDERAAMVLEDVRAKLEGGYIAVAYGEDARIGAINRRLTEAGIDVYRIYESLRSLEELFLEFTRDAEL
ncbi:Daunorubicin/doxorubicin resistance ATP-binding protein DrrA [Aedoeadaptatus ivorii]|uniref:Daunorubicin/doxorubicin resistance ATP-binding protein DrrA n=2 Tax=Aedoeadaptatus ivorii TaxID=54006 RepID=A0A448UZS9_9FIRM|nr:Daunorubicin/doxorubicin resistance ATP-binding protein DrrA [Peptoniphilus ivorii]